MKAVHFRYILYAILAALSIAVLTGNLGGARDAASNYHKVMSGQG